MFAEVYPLTRLPRRFTFFDYAIPESVEVAVGDAVRVPLRGRKIMGVVRALKDATEFERISEIEEVIAPGLLAQEDLKRIETISRAIDQAPSSVLNAALQLWKPLKADLDTVDTPAGSRSISKGDAEVIQRAFETVGSEKPMSLQLSKEGEIALAQTLRKKFSGQILILCPREREAELVAKSAALGPAAVLHGHVSSSGRRSVIEAWRSGMLRTLIGTRQAVLLPAEHIDAVLVMDSGSDEYGKLDRNPRIDTRPAAKLLSKQHGADLIFSGPLPRVDELNSDVEIIFQKPDAQIVNLSAQEERIGVPLLSATLRNSITSALRNSERILLVYNKKGVAKRLQCSACGHIPLCGNCSAVPSVRVNDLVCSVCKTEMWAPKTCPSCGSQKLRERGIGNQRLAKELANRFANANALASVAIIDEQHREPSDADILIVTEYYFKNLIEPFQKRQFGVVADLAFDLALSGSDFRAAEHAAYKLHRLAFLARQQHAECIVQTWLPGMAHGMLKSKEWLQKELETRQKYGLPPAKPLIRKVDKTAKTRYKEPQTIVDTDDYENLRRSEKSE